MHAIKQHPLTCIFVSTCSMHTDRPLVGYTCKKRTVHCKLSTGVNNIVLHPVNNIVLPINCEQCCAAPREQCCAACCAAPSEQYCAANCEQCYAANCEQCMLCCTQWTKMLSTRLFSHDNIMLQLQHCSTINTVTTC